MRRAKLYYLRNVTGKAARIRERKVVKGQRGGSVASAAAAQPTQAQTSQS